MLLKLTARIVKFCIFFQKLKKLGARFQIGRRMAAERCFSNLESMIDSTVRYYTGELYYPLKYYRDLLRDYMRNPSRHYNNEALNLLSALINKLKCTGLPT